MIRISIFLASILLFSCCRSTKTSIVTVENVPENEVSILQEECTVTGLLSVSDGHAVLTKNPESRGRVTFELSAEDKIFSQIQEKNGQIITVCGVVLEERSPWHKFLSVTEIK